MQDRGCLSGFGGEAVQELDPLTVNENLVTLRKMRALIASHPGVDYFKSSSTYTFVLDNRDNTIVLTKSLKLELQPLFVDLSKLESLSAEEKVKFAVFLRHLKKYSLAHKDQLILQKDILESYKKHFFAFEDESNTVICRYVTLSNSLVVYPRKRHSEDRRFAVLNAKINAGAYGSIFSSHRSLSCSQDINVDFTVKDKTSNKHRVVKIQSDRLNRAYNECAETREYILTVKLAPELAVKPLVRNKEQNQNALLMHRVPGEDLNNLLDTQEIESDLQRLEVCLAMANSLQQVHDRNGIHRDIKPENVILLKGKDGQYIAQFIDFGLSMLQSEANNRMAGSLFFMPPESYDGCYATVASDVYSLGRSFEMVFGYSPSWVRGAGDQRSLVRKCEENAARAFDEEVIKLDRSHRETLKMLGWDALLDDMRKVSPAERVSLGAVIERLKVLIDAFKAKIANESQPITSSAAAAASESNLESENCAHNKSNLRP